MKRSKHVALVILGAAAFTLAGCKSDEVDAQAFPDIASCKAAAERGGLFSAQECDAAFNEAQKLHVETAPRYENREACEAQHGAGACGTEAEATAGAAATPAGEQQQASGGGMGSIFMPMIAGYLMGSMLSGARGAGVAPSQPMYRTPDGKFTTASGGSTFSSNSGATKLSSSQFTKPATTIGKPPMSAATAQSRGGFGATGRTSGSSGGFGG